VLAGGVQAAGAGHAQLGGALLGLRKCMQTQCATAHRYWSR
jgi:hypothetical protein